MQRISPRDPVRILTLGTGQMGAGIIRAVLETPGLELVGSFARRRERAGLDLGQALALGRHLDLTIGSDLAQLVAGARPQVAIQATCSRLTDALPELEPLLEAGVSVVSIAEEMAWPAASSPELAARLDRLARAGGAALLGTGVNPGFVLDLLPVALSGVCTRVERISATRVNDLSAYGPTVLASQGVGLTPDAFRRGVDAGTVAGHFGFPQSIGMIASALGWEVEQIEERREPIVSSVERETLFIRISPGQVAGCHHTAVAQVAGREAIRLDHPQQIRPELEGVATGDTIEIRGAPGVRLSGSPEIAGAAATIALAVNAVPRVLEAAPGLHSMLDLPVPAALPGAAHAAVLDPTGTRGRDE
jgi:4-hydroxy-tetrahydrodipicolinate reductase